MQLSSEKVLTGFNWRGCDSLFRVGAKQFDAPYRVRFMQRRIHSDSCISRCREQLPYELLLQGMHDLHMHAPVPTSQLSQIRPCHTPYNFQIPASSSSNRNYQNLYLTNIELATKETNSIENNVLLKTVLGRTEH